MKISIIIPAYNEEKHIEATVKAVKALDVPKEIIVVDDGSADGTSDLAEKTGAKVIRILKNGGKGRALEQGLKHSVGNIIVFLDADVGDGAIQLQKLLCPIISKDADMTVAIFPPAKRRGGFGLVKNLAKVGVFVGTGQWVPWALSGQRAFRRELLDGIRLARDYGVEVGLTIDVLRRGFIVEGVEVEMEHRETLRDLPGFIHRGRQFANIFKTLLRTYIK